MGGPQTAEILLDTPEVRVEAAEEDGADSEVAVSLNGTMFHEGLNANAWGLTEDGAKSIAASLEGADLTAGHPPVKGYGFTRSIHDGPGMPIGSVDNTAVTIVEGATMAEAGGGYTATYSADVGDSTYSQRFRDGLMIGGDYGVSIGMTASDENAVCSVCESNFAECKHVRGENVDGQIAGPLYTDGEGDHLAVVYVPAYDRADSDVEGAMLASTADEFFGQPFDHDQPAAGTDDQPPEPTAGQAARDGLQVEVTPQPEFNLEL